MKILATSDLHMFYTGSETIKELKMIINKCKPDVIVISGDVYDNKQINPFKELNTLGCPVVFCLGNHEFAYSNVNMVHLLYENREDCPNVYCLDTCGHVDIDSVRFVGNVLWYDGSLSDRLDKQEKLEHIVDNWLDSTINNFKPINENRKCIKQIKENLNNWSGKKVLVTHTVPYWKLNCFSYDMPGGVYNIYSGVKDLFYNDDINVDVAICGHTHRRSRIFYQEDGKEIACYNIGNEYWDKSKKLEYEMIEL